MRKLWSRFELIQADGRIEVDNHWEENGMRQIALVRKNWLHIGSEAAGRHMAALASVVETCKHNRISVRKYVQSVLPRRNAILAKRVSDLTPME
jgi:transposase